MKFFKKKAKAVNHKKNCLINFEISDNRYELIISVSLFTFVENLLNEYYKFTELKDKKPISYFLKKFEIDSFDLTNDFVFYFIRELITKHIGEDLKDEDIQKEIAKNGTNNLSNQIIYIILFLKLGGEVGEPLARVLAIRMIKNKKL